jgi:hypothetical protein
LLTCVEFLSAGATAGDRVKQRLEELDSSQAREQAVLLQLNQKVCFPLLDDVHVTLMRIGLQDYIRHIQALNKELVDAWHKEERVKALKIVIQVRACPRGRRSSV